MSKQASGISIGRGKVSVGRRAALVVLADLAAGLWLALQVRGKARAGGGSVVYLPVVHVAARLVWDMPGETWDNGAVWG